MEIIAALAIAVLLWFAWQLYRAKQFNRFKQQIINDFKPLVIKHIKQSLDENRNELFPNNACHQQATIYFWCQYPSRLLQAAMRWELIDKDWLVKTGNVRNCQHLFFIEQDKLAHFYDKQE